ncbi:hypothetical protein Tco_0775814 [Tanacetum coccineum]
MTYFVASLTLDSANSCVMQGLSCTQRKVSMVPFVFSIPFVLSWGGSISSDSFLPSILLLMVIIITVVIVVVILIVVVVLIVGVVIVVAIIGVVVVVGGVSSILKLLFVIIVADVEYSKPGLSIKEQKTIGWKQVKGNDVLTYTKRFQELILICTKFVANETEKVDKYISGLPDNIYGNVKSANPRILKELLSWPTT